MIVISPAEQPDRDGLEVTLAGALWARVLTPLPNRCGLTSRWGASATSLSRWGRDLGAFFFALWHRPVGRKKIVLYGFARLSNRNAPVRVLPEFWATHCPTAVTAQASAREIAANQFRQSLS